MRAHKVMRPSTLLAALLLVHATALTDTIIMRADPWYPVNLDPDDERPGYVVEIAQAALARAGHQLDYALYPWERSVDGARRGQIDCLPGVHRNTVPDFIFMTESVGINRIAFYTRNDAPPFEYRGLANLQDKVLAVIGGYGYSDEIDAYIKSASFGPALQVTRGDRPLERNIRMLLAGRVDLVLESIAALEHTAAEMGVLSQLKRAAQLPDLVPIYIACSPAKRSSRDYVKVLDEGVRELRASGELQRILEKYGMRDWQQNAASE